MLSDGRNSGPRPEPDSDRESDVELSEDDLRLLEAARAELESQLDNWLSAVRVDYRCSRLLPDPPKRRRK